jgi:hypothetical protein
MQRESPILLKIADASGRLTLGRKHSGRTFEVEKLASGELLLRPVRPIRETAGPARTSPGLAPAFQIAEVDQLVLPGRL